MGAAPKDAADNAIRSTPIKYSIDMPEKENV
jgi:hypothetical protein